MRKTLFLSDVKETTHPDYKFEAPYIFFSHKYRRFRIPKMAWYEHISYLREWLKSRFVFVCIIKEMFVIQYEVCQFYWFFNETIVVLGY